MRKKALVLGSAGFIGSNLCSSLEKKGYEVTGCDINTHRWGRPTIELNYDLRYLSCEEVFNDDYDEVYVLACLMGGMGFIGDEETNGYDIAIGSTQIVINSIHWVKKYCPKAIVFYSSSACVYNQDLQLNSDVVALKESTAIPANPDLLYGWQKLFSEKMMMASGLNVRIARFHNIFGERGIYKGGKEKAPAALCRKIALAEDGNEIEVWGSGIQTRSFLYIEECLDGIERLMNSDYSKPINIGSDELISINDLAKMVIEISGKRLTIKNVDGNVGVMGRNSDNTLCKEVLGWSPSKPLREGMEKLYSWVNKQVNG